MRSVLGVDVGGTFTDFVVYDPRTKQVEVWTDLPRSKLGKILKNEVKSQLLSQADDHRH